MPNALTLGVGELESQTPRGEFLSIVHLRSHFLKKIRILNPQVLHDLAEKLFPIYREIELFCFEADPRRFGLYTGSPLEDAWCRKDFVDDALPDWYQLEDAWSSRDPAAPFLFKWPTHYTEGLASLAPPAAVRTHPDPRIETFIRLMFDWSKDYHLTAAWCRHHAFETLNLWSARPELLGKGWQPLPFDLAARLVDMPPYSINDIDFDTSIRPGISRHLLHLYPTCSHRAEIMRELNELDSQLKELRANVIRFLDRCDTEAKADPALIPSRKKRSLDHVEWFARVQTGTATYDDLDKEYYRSEREAKPYYKSPDDCGTIRGAVSKISLLLGLRVRADVSTPGQRRKSETPTK
jgi:hypothetical protein